MNFMVAILVTFCVGAFVRDVKDTIITLKTSGLFYSCQA